MISWALCAAIVAAAPAGERWPWAGTPAFQAGTAGVLAPGRATVALAAGTSLDASGGLGSRHRGSGRLTLGLGHGVEAAAAAESAQMGLAGTLRAGPDSLALRWALAGPRPLAWAPALGAALILPPRGPLRLAARVDLGPPLGAGAGAGQGLAWLSFDRALAGSERRHTYALGAGLGTVLPGTAGVLAMSAEAWLTASDRAGARGHLIAMAPRVGLALSWRPAAAAWVRAALAVGPDVRRDSEAQIARFTVTPQVLVAWLS